MTGCAFSINRLNGLERPIGFTNGCFDLFHYGHLHSLRQAKKNVRSLVVGVNSDVSASILKGVTRPIIKDVHRLEIVRELKCVDYAFLFDELTVNRYIELISPDFYIKGSEWKNKLPEKIGNKTSLVFIDRLDGISTTEMINKLRR
jgi:D-beta-D-heptose 7-phosphate kinase/D-beta-D-heptose 1-phosphate adenosyltransferase|tara:strand:+ start:216 stop:653 length:438 start_codon:yes stop_codon:yes gene_type:complete